MKKREFSKIEIFNSIKKILVEKNHADLSVNYDTFLDKISENSLLMTSIEVIDFILEIEQFFGIIVDISERFYTIEDAVNSIYNHLNEGKKDVF